MPTFRVKTDSGTFEFEGPEGATPDQAISLAKQYLQTSQPQKKFAEPVYGGTFSPEDRPTSFGQGVVEGALVPLNNAARALESGAEAIGIAEPIANLGKSIGLAGSVGEAEAAQQAASDASATQGSRLGHFAGEVLGTLPTSVIKGGVAAQGAIGGALTTDARDPVGVAWDAATGAAGALGINKLFKGGAQLAAPYVSEGLETLIRAGGSVTPGQFGRSLGSALGKAVGAIEDKASSLPVVGDLINRDRGRSFEDFGRATINRALGAIGEALPEGLAVGRRAVAHAGNRLSNAYNQVTANIGKFATDAQFADDLAQIEGLAADMLPDRARQLKNVLGGLGRFFGDDGTTLDGNALKSIETRLGERIRRYSRSQDADQLDLADALESARSAVRDLAARANPAQSETLQAINKGWASLVQVEKASLNNTGKITPAGYSDAVRASESSTRRRGYARGESLNQDLADAGSEILPSQIADSGTAGRIWQSNLLGLGIGTAAAVPYTLARIGTQAVQARAQQPATAAALTASDYLRRLAQAAPYVAPALISENR